MASERIWKKGKEDCSKGVSRPSRGRGLKGERRGSMGREKGPHAQASVLPRGSVGTRLSLTISLQNGFAFSVIWSPHYLSDFFLWLTPSLASFQSLWLHVIPLILQEYHHQDIYICHPVCPESCVASSIISCICAQRPLPCLVVLDHPIVYF